MPLFVVVFDQAVIYQPDHPKATRGIAAGIEGGLRVSAPSALSAMRHATRTTRGTGGPCAVYDREGHLVWGDGPPAIVIAPPPQPVVEVPVGEIAEVFSA